MGTTALMTVEAFSSMRTGEREDYELIEGELIPLASGTPQQGFVRDFIAHEVGSYFRRSPLGRVITETDCQTAEHTIYRPDVSIFFGERIGQIDLRKIPIPFPPDIAVEVLSPSEGAIEVNRKVRDYLTGGSREVWVVDPVNGELFAHTREDIRMLDAEDALETSLLPGFSVRVSDVFAGL